MKDTNERNAANKKILDANFKKKAQEYIMKKKDKLPALCAIIGYLLMCIIFYSTNNCSEKELNKEPVEETSEDTSQEVVYSTKKIQVDIEAEITITEDAKFVPLITTNLPEGMEVNARLMDSAEISSFGDLGSWVKGHVEDGKLIFERDFRHSLPNGKFKFTLFTSGAFTQPDHIQKIIGSNGENLMGKYTKENFMISGRGLKFSKDFSVNIEGNINMNLSKDLDEEIKSMVTSYEEMKAFVHTAHFKEWGFAVGNPDKTYIKWRERISKEENNADRDITIKIIGKYDVSWNLLFCIALEAIRGELKGVRLEQMNDFEAMARDREQPPRGIPL